MSDPVSNSDIEDVLSSIRRLVSEEPTARKSPDPEEAARAERLVLTPAFRVESDPDDVSDDLDEARADDAPFEEAGEEAEPTLAPILLMPNGTVEEIQTAQDAPMETAPDVQAFEPGTDGQAHGLEDAATDVAPEAPTESATEEATPAVHPAEMSLEDRIAELEAAIERAPQEWEPDGSEAGDDDETRPLSADLAATETSAPLAEDDPQQISLEELASLMPAQDPVPPQEEATPDIDLSTIDFVFADGSAPQAEQEVLQAPEGAPEDLSGAAEAEYTTIDPDLVEDAEILPSVDDTLAPSETPGEGALDTDLSEAPEADADAEHGDGAEQDTDQAALDKAAAAWEEEASAEASASLDEDHAEHTTDATSDTDNILDQEDMVTMDEAALRELVGDLVRDELQGMLGERITRNVRRLVRHEIQRALSVRDLQK